MTAYNKFMAAEVPRAKLTLTALAGRARERAAFAKAAANWELSSLNPKNAQATTVHGGADGGAGVTAGGPLNGAACDHTADAADGDVHSEEEGEEAFEDALELAEGACDEEAGDDVFEDAREGDGREGIGDPDVPAPRQDKVPGRARHADPKGTPNKGGARKRRCVTR